MELGLPAAGARPAFGMDDVGAVDPTAVAAYGSFTAVAA
jgi:hypothetical protein